MNLLAPASPAAAALELIGVSKAYGGVRAIEQVSFRVMPGEFVALLGPSGAGKSTVFRCVTRLVRPDAGEVRVLGDRMETLAGAALRRKRRAIGLVFQQFNLIPRLTAVENVLAGRLGGVGFWRALFRRFPAEDRQIALAALDRVGLLGKAYQRADSLSGGQQQRVAIARVLAQRSRLLLADEPVSSLDPAAARNVLGLLRAIAREDGIAVLCSLHQTDLARAYADRIVALEDGRLVFERQVAAVDDAAIRELYRLEQPAEA